MQIDENEIRNVMNMDIYLYYIKHTGILIPA